MVKRSSTLPPGHAEEGSSLVMCAVVLLAIFVCLALGYGVAGAMTIRSGQESALSVVRENEMAPAVSLAVKNATDPGMNIARKAVDDLRHTGFSDAIEVWFYEVPSYEIPAERRIYAYEVVLKNPYGVPFGGAVGLDQIEIASSVVTSAMPYAEFSAWRPSAARCGVFRATPNSSAINFEQNTCRDDSRYKEPLQSLPVAASRRLLGKVWGSGVTKRMDWTRQNEGVEADPFFIGRS